MNLTGASMKRVLGHLNSTGITVLAGFLINVIYARMLNLSDRGSLAAALHLLYIVSYFAGAGLDRAIATSSLDVGLNGTRRVAAVILAKRSKYVAAAGVIGAIGAAVAFDISLSVVTLLIFVGGIGNGAGLGVRASGLASGNTWQVGFITLGLQILNGSIFLALAAAGYANWRTALAVFAVVALANIVVLRLSRTTEEEAVKIDAVIPKIQKTAFDYSVGFIAMRVSMRADRLILPVFTSTTVLGAYVVPAALAEMAAVGVSAISEALMPVVGRYQASLRKSFAKVVILATVLGGAAIFAATLVVLIVLTAPIFGRDFEPSMALATALATGASLLAVGQTHGNLLAVLGESTKVRRSELVGSLIAVPLYFVMIPTWGAVGAAWAASLAYGLVAILNLSLVIRALSEGARTISQRNGEYVS